VRHALDVELVRGEAEDRHGADRQRAGEDQVMQGVAGEYPARDDGPGADDDAQSSSRSGRRVTTIGERETGRDDERPDPDAEGEPLGRRLRERDVCEAGSPRRNSR
jgi:hypothetical protein